MRHQSYSEQMASVCTTEKIFHNLKWLTPFICKLGLFVTEGNYFRLFKKKQRVCFLFLLICQQKLRL
jgi:hypothetical protein